MNQPIITIIGDVDSGKSTIIGQLLTATKSIPSELLKKVQKFCIDQQIDFEPAYLVDYIKQERIGKSTMEWALCTMKIAGKEVLFIDTPGQMALSKRMVSGLTQANIVILLIDIIDTTDEKIKFYSNLLNFLNVSKFIVVINKVDLIQYDEHRYNKFVDKVKEILNREAEIIPIAAIVPANINHPHPELPWYRGETLLKALENKIETNESSESEELVFPVQDVFPNENHKILLGQVVSGKISKSENVYAITEKGASEVLSVEHLWHLDKESKELNYSENGGVLLNKDIGLKRGDILVRNLKELELKEVIRLKLYTLDKINVTEKYFLRFLTKTIPVRKIKILGKFDEQLEDLPDESMPEANSFTRAVVELEDALPVMSEFVRRKVNYAEQVVIENDNGEMVAMGLID